MGNYAAEVRINTKIDTSQMLKLQNQIDRAAMKVDALTKKYEELKNQKIPTKQYMELEEKLKNAKLALELFRDEQEKLSSSGIKPEFAKEVSQVYAVVQKLKSDLNQAIEDRDADAYLAIEDRLNRAKSILQEMMRGSKNTLGEITYYNSIEEKLENAKSNVDAISNEMQNLVDAGEAFNFTPGDPEKIAKAAQELRIAKGELKALVTKQDELNRKQDTTVEKSKKVSDGFKKIASTAKKGLATMSGHVKQTDGLLSTMASRIKGLLLSLLIFNWISKGFNAMVSGIKDGFKNLVKYSDDYNQSVSALKSANTQMKNSFATAFMPIVQAVIPHLISLMNYITLASNAVARFTATLTGKSTWIRATQVQEDYAASLDGTAAAAKKAAGALASFDTLEVLNKNDASGGASGTSAKDMFEEVPLDPVTFDPKEFGRNLSDKLADALENIDWEEIKGKAEQLGRDFADILNGIWENERLARDLGVTIGEAANTAVRFAYGFIDEHEWEQMGRFLGILVQTGLDTFDEEMAGKTAGMLVNGLADSIIGYFQEYKAGSLGAEIASFLNRAVEEVDADKVGEAASLLVGGCLKEISTFFTDTDFEEIGSKISDIVIASLEYTADDGNAGQKAGEALASIINAGVALLLGADTTGMAEAMGGFLTDMLITAVGDIGWEKVFQMLWKGFTNLVDVPEAIGKGIGGSILKACGFDDATIEEAKNKSWALGAVIDSFVNGVKPFSAEKYASEYSSLGDAIDGLGNKVESFVTKTYAMQSGKIFDVSDLQQLQTELGLLDSDIDAIIQSMIEANGQIDISTLGLEGYTGNWETFKTTLSESVSIVETFKNENEAMTESVGNDYVKMASSAETASDKVGVSIDGMGEKTKNLRERLTELSEHTSTTMDSVSQKASGAGDSFSKLNTDASTSLDNTSSKLDSWFTDSVEPYFSQEQWNLFSQNVSVSMAECLDTFMEDWTASFDEWKESNEELYFGYDTWYEQFENIMLAYADVNAEFMAEWQTNTDTWWNTMVMPFFTVEQWKIFGTNMKTGIMTGFKAIVNEIGGVLNNVIYMFDEAFEELEEAINDLIDSYNASASTLGTSKLSKVHYKAMGGVQIPALANGAVIRGGNPFLAILGDQRAGQTNIEAPISTIREAVREELSAFRIGSGQMKVVLNLNGEHVGEAMLDDLLSVMNRRGYDVDVLRGV